MTGDSTVTSPFEPAGIRLGVVRGISYGLFGPPGEFVPQARALGAGLIRAYLFWSQAEPGPGRYDWGTVDRLLAQLDGSEEVWLTVCSSSPWATRQATDFLPPSPAHDQAAYGEFVRRLVRHCGGRVRYWQCDNEPSNTGLLWAGTAAEYVTQLATFYRAVKEADPAAAVVLGGCGYDVLSSEPGSEPRQFFSHLAKAGRDFFDLFSVHLYGGLASLPGYLDDARQIMRAHGYVKPLVAGELAGPQPFEFPAAMAAVQQAFAAAFTGTGEAPGQSTGELAERVSQDTPEHRAMDALYARMSELPPELAMFLVGCPDKLEARRQRIQCRQIVQRTMLALAGGVRRTAYWNLAPEAPGPADHRQMMSLLIGKLPLMEYGGRELTVRLPAAGTFALLTRQLAGATEVTRRELASHPSVRAFEVTRDGRGPLLVLWDQRDTFHGEDEPPVPVRLPWRAPSATVTDAFGETWPVNAEDGALPLRLGATPLFAEPAPTATSAG
ncbi:MAG TPA: hypothetical protein VGQ05_19470 [Streptosporangiaceae bacterium]|nr:hypothetical protein [Streptosporangiaceae bacterium]